MPKSGSDEKDREKQRQKIARLIRKYTIDDKQRAERDVSAVARWINASGQETTYWAAVRIIAMGKPGVQIDDAVMPLSPKEALERFPWLGHPRAGMLHQSRPGEPIFEAGNVFSHWLDKLGRCRWCKNLMYRPTKRRVFCSEGCRLDFFRLDPIEKKKHQLNAEKNRNDWKVDRTFKLKATR